ncbi:histamine N-methyltransferase-like [Branchiostoma lanceolatum]|uniref:histamine N-methyltransferase-like n=1 Tax=Branchiostoma lanceolatum TaxID=7740 RepID=UPI00345659A5
MVTVGGLIEHSQERYLAAFTVFVAALETSQEHYRLSYGSKVPDSTLCEAGTDVRVLGIGSGSGGIDIVILKKLLQRHNSMYNRVVEPSGEMIERYKTLVRGDTSLGAVKFDWRQLTAEEYFKTKEDTKFHLIHAVHVLYHVDDPYATLRDMWEQLADGGCMLVAMESDKSDWGNLGHKLKDTFGQGDHDHLKRSFRMSGDVKQWLDTAGISYVTAEDENNINVTEFLRRTRRREGCF